MPGFWTIADEIADFRKCESFMIHKPIIADINENPAIYPSKSNDSVSVMVSPDSRSTLVNLVDLISSQLAQHLQKNPHLPLVPLKYRGFSLCLPFSRAILVRYPRFRRHPHTFEFITKWFIHSFSRSWITFNLSWRHVLNIVLCWNVLTLRLPFFSA